VVVGVGAEEGIGAALCRRFAAGGYHVIVAGRTPAKIDQVARGIVAGGGRAESFALDSSNEAEVIALFDRAMSGEGGRGPCEAVLFNAATLNRPADFREMSAERFEEVWRVSCFGGFLVGREAARRLLPLGHGTVIFTGASASLRGRPGFAQFASAKAGLRMIAQSMAREYGPHGIHVAHILIDGGVNGERLRSAAPAMVEQRGEGGLLNVDAIAETYWQIHRQHPSAWAQEVDLRPYKEPF
jgi:NAD(P)-dependent dehydrogenase (short-subunit alcohol dehydrogenase family)